MSSINQEDVIQIMKMVEDSAFNELHLQEGELKLVIKKGGKSAMLHEESEPSIQIQVPQEAVEKADVGTPKQPPMVEPTQEVEEGFIAIKAPMLGTFYSSSKPGAPPFVEVGQLVTEEDTVCIIEVMKLFNTVKAGVRGRIAKVFAENSQMVEYNQPLFLVEEEKGGEVN